MWPVRGRVPRRGPLRQLLAMCLSGPLGLRGQFRLAAPAKHVGQCPLAAHQHGVNQRLVRMLDQQGFALGDGPFQIRSSLR